MKLPTVLYRRKSDVYKNNFGHALILAGSKCMPGAAALCGLAAMRAGAGLVTLGVPESLNAVVHKKIPNEIMTLPLRETRKQTISRMAFGQVRDFYLKCNVVAIGPGLTMDSVTQRFVLKVIETSPHPLVIDADGLNILSRGNNLDVLKDVKTVKVLTPHVGEMARLTQLRKIDIEKDRNQVAFEFAKKFDCVLLLKGSRTVVASANGELYVNKTGNSGMATAGSGDVLTGIIAAFLAQGLSGFEAAKYGAYVHGRAGDFVAEARTRLSMIASDIIEYIPEVVRSC